VTLTLMYNLAMSYWILGQHDEAMALYDETLVRQKKALGPDHPDTLRTMNSIAYKYGQLGRHAESLALNEETLSLSKAKLGPDHPETLMSMSNTAIAYRDVGRDADSLALHEQTLQLRKLQLGPDHIDTLDSMYNVAEQLVKLRRGAEALPIIDECVQRAAGRIVDPGFIPAVIDLRLQHFTMTDDVAGCLETADRFEALGRTDINSLYHSAHFRALCAAEIQHAEPSPQNDALAREQANRAMVWLRKAVNAGLTDVAFLKKDESLDALRDREDFRALIAELERSAENTNQQPAVPLESHKPKPSKETSP
jgi:tetratricopeptide (TPR) repeat protein